MLLGNVLGCGGETVEVSGRESTKSGHLEEMVAVVKEIVREPRGRERAKISKTAFRFF